MKTKGAKNGRYGNAVDKAQFEKLCSILCSEQEIADFFGVTVATMNNFCNKEYGKTFGDVRKEKGSLGKISLRRVQFKQAETNPTMAIWLGKQYLGQTDKADVSIEDKIEIINDVPKKEKE